MSDFRVKDSAICRMTFPSKPYHQYMIECQESAIEGVYRMIRLFEMQILQEDQNLSDIEQAKEYVKKLYEAIGLIAIPNNVTESLQDDLVRKIYGDIPKNKQITGV